MYYKFLLVLPIAFTFFSEPASSADKSSRVSSTPAIEIRANRPEEEDSGYIEHGGDPIEPINRGVFMFNEAVDDAVLEPVSRVYKNYVPEWGRDRVGNFLENLGTPVTFFNSLLQGDVDNAFASFWRFVLNSTIGIGGLFDQAEIAGLSARNEDFGQTLGHYGADPGPYIVIPLLGPSTARDAVGLVVDSVTNPFNYVTGEAIATRVASETIHGRSELLELTDEIEKTSFDPYSTYRSAYFQRRGDLVTNGGER